MSEIMEEGKVFGAVDNPVRAGCLLCESFPTHFFGGVQVLGWRYTFVIF
jgi:hypothetical protein